MRKICILLLIVLLVLTACAAPVKKQLVSTPMDAAKSFITALTSGNMVQLNQNVYQSQSMPTDEIMNIAKMRKITGMKPSQFTIKADPKDKETLYVSFKDKSGEKDIWKLVFVQNAAGNYQYAGYMSGVLFSNNSPVDLAKSYAETLIHNADRYWESNIAEARPVDGVSIDLEMVKHYSLNKKTLKDFSFVSYKSDPQRVFVKFHNGGKLLYFDIFARKDTDGYYLDGTQGVSEW